MPDFMSSRQSSEKNPVGRGFYWVIRPGDLCCYEKSMSGEGLESHGLIFGGRLTETYFLITPRTHVWTSVFQRLDQCDAHFSCTNITDCVRHPNTTAPIHGGNCVLSQLTTGDSRRSSASRLTRIIQQRKQNPAPFFTKRPRMQFKNDIIPPPPPAVWISKVHRWPFPSHAGTRGGEHRHVIHGRENYRHSPIVQWWHWGSGIKRRKNYSWSTLPPPPS